MAQDASLHGRTDASPVHTKDEECDVNPENDGCRGCGVQHGEPCDLCGGRGFHRDGCPDSDATPGSDVLAVIRDAPDDYAIVTNDGEVLREGLHHEDLVAAFAEEAVADSDEANAPCGFCGSTRENHIGCVACCRDCGFTCSSQKDAEGFHADDYEDALDAFDEPSACSGACDDPLCDGCEAPELGGEA